MPSITARAQPIPDLDISLAHATAANFDKILQLEAGFCGVSLSVTGGTMKVDLLICSFHSLGMQHFAVVSCLVFILVVDTHFDARIPCSTTLHGGNPGNKSSFPIHELFDLCLSQLSPQQNELTLNLLSLSTAEQHTAGKRSMFALDAEAEETFVLNLKGFKEIELLFVAKSSFGDPSEGALKAVELGPDTGSRSGLGPLIHNRFAISPHAIEDIELEPSTCVHSIAGPRNLQPLNIVPDVGSTVVFVFELLIIVDVGGHMKFIVRHIMISGDRTVVDMFFSFGAG